MLIDSTYQIVRISLSLIEPKDVLNARLQCTAPETPRCLSLTKINSLQFLLQEMLRLVRGLEVNMNIRPLHIGQALELHLQLFCCIMTDL